jgi:SAM-dependent MidA family methyltransferase
VHPVFAETLADAIIRIWQEEGYSRPALVEIGGGTGILMKHLSARIYEAAPLLADRMRLVMIESSPYHRECQRQALAGCQADVVWYAAVEEAVQSEAIEGVILSNEWFDAFPVHLVKRQAAGWTEAGVTWDEGEGCLKWMDLPALTPEAADYLAEEKLALPTGMQLEINLGMRRAIHEVSRMLVRGYVITIDYGGLQDELYSARRMSGTLQCYYRHRAHDDPLVFVGEQDITAHVNFSALMKWGEEAGLVPVSLESQSQFLVKAGILQKLREHQDTNPFTSEAMRSNQAIRQLISPDGMGGTFRVLTQKKDAR